MLQAVVVEMDASSVNGGGPLMSTACQELARNVLPGQHVLVKPGEQVQTLDTAFGDDRSLGLQSRIIYCGKKVLSRTPP